jgi:hypothetical protein
VLAIVDFAGSNSSLALGVATDEAVAVTVFVGVIGNIASRLERWSRSSANFETLARGVREEGVVLVDVLERKAGEAEVLAALAVAFFVGNGDGSGRSAANLEAEGLEVAEGVIDGVGAGFAAAGAFVVGVESLVGELPVESVKRRFLALLATFGVAGAEAVGVPIMGFEFRGWGTSGMLAVAEASCCEGDAVGSSGAGNAEGLCCGAPSSEIDARLLKRYITLVFA